MEKYKKEKIIFIISNSILIILVLLAGYKIISKLYLVIYLILLIIYNLIRIRLEFTPKKIIHKKVKKLNKELSKT